MNWLLFQVLGGFDASEKGCQIFFYLLRFTQLMIYILIDKHFLAGSNNTNEISFFHSNTHFSKYGNKIPNRKEHYHKSQNKNLFLSLTEISLTVLFNLIVFTP